MFFLSLKNNCPWTPIVILINESNQRTGPIKTDFDAPVLLTKPGVYYLMVHFRYSMFSK